MIKTKNKIIYLLLALFLILALIFNANNFMGFFYNSLGNIYYKAHSFENATNYHKKADEKLSNNTTKYNLWWDYYKLWDYKKAKEYFDNIKTETWKVEDLEMDYNLGNTHYRLWEKDQNIQNKIELWKNSLNNYQKVLEKKKNKKTQENYDFVEKKLKDLEDKNKDNNKEQDKKTNEQKWQWDSNDESKQWWEQQDKNWKEEDWISKWEKKQDEASKQKNKSWKWESTDTKKDSEKKSLSEEEQKQLEQYNEQLKQEQKNNSSFFGKKNQGNSQDIFDIFNQDPFFGNTQNFDDSILNKNDKDW